MSTLIAAVLCSLLTFAYGHDDVIYPSIYGQQQLATRLHCQIEETQHFHYSSDTKLWESSGGDIKVTADVVLHCLGDDRGGRFESQALKYLAEITNVVIKPSSEKRNEEQQRRKEESRKKENENEEGGDSEDLRRLYSVPFQFVQFANGSVPEIRFSENETDDGRIRNFKRHIVDAFSSQLNFNQEQKQVVERTVTGEHASLYTVTVNSVLHPLIQNSMAEEEEPTVTVEKLVTEKDIRNFAASEALNDKDSMHITLKQTQIFKGGRMLSSSGTSSVVLLPDNEVVQKRRKREDKDDVTSKFQAQSSFDLRLRRRQRRSPTESARVGMHENLSFAPVSRFAEKEGNPERLSLERLQQASGGMAQLFEKFLQSQGKDYKEKMQMMYEMVHREVNLKLDNEPLSASSIVRDKLDQQTMEAMCNDNFATCKDLLQLLAVTGGPKAEEVFLSFFRKNTGFTSNQLRSISSILADLSSPSVGFLDSLVQIISEKRFDQKVLGSVCLGTGSLGSKAELKTKNKIAKMFIDLLDKHRNNCHSDTFLLDILEAVGNLGSRKTVPAVLEVSRHCRESSSIQIACAHALRYNSDLSSVKEWMQSMTTDDSDCEVVKAIVGSLIDKMHEQRMTADTTNWPRNGFNQVDENLKHLLIQSRCSVRDITLYFGKKRDPVANGIAASYFGPEAESVSKDGSINKHVEYSIGMKGANAKIYADMIGGVKDPSGKPEYKLTSNFAAKLNFLGSEREIGSFSFYNHSGNIQAYLRILGQTRQELANGGCEPKDDKSRFSKEIPWFSFNILAVKLSLGIHLSGEVGVETKCPSKEIYQFVPMMAFSAEGGATGTVLVVRGGVNLKGNFNYKFEFTYTPFPYLCFKASHGYDPMGVSFEAFFQFWNFWRWNWGDRRSWQPNFLSWKTDKGLSKTLFDGCLLRRDNSSLSEMYIEKDTKLSDASKKYRNEQIIRNDWGKPVMKI